MRPLRRVEPTLARYAFKSAEGPPMCEEQTHELVPDDDDDRGAMSFTAGLPAT